MSNAPNVTAAAIQIKEEIGIDSNVYFSSLRDGSMSLEEFRLSQEQFFFCVAFFSRPMMALVGRIPDPSRRLEILRNVVEEHGEFEETAFHQSTFASFLSSIGSDVRALEDENFQWPEVRAFNSSLIGACLLDELEVGIACMGVIEFCFVNISSAIATGVVERQWIDQAELRHYKLHETVDIRHAEDFFELIEESWSDASRRALTEQGLRLGVYLFNQLYLSLYESAKRHASV